MICVDKILFNFIASDISFTYELYADWDKFYQDVIEPIINEVLSPFDKEMIPDCINRLELNIGSIPENHFFEIFPVRFRSELEQAMLIHIHNDSDIVSRDGSYSDSLTNNESAIIGIKNQDVLGAGNETYYNIMHYLTFGSCEVNGLNKDFNLQAEIKKIMKPEMKGVATLVQECFILFSQTYPNAFERLMLHLDDSSFHEMLNAWLESPDILQSDKQLAVLIFSIKYPDLFLQILDKTKWKKRLIALLDWKELESLITKLSKQEMEQLWQTINGLPEDTRPGWFIDEKSVKQFVTLLNEWIEKNREVVGSVSVGNQEELGKQLNLALWHCLNQCGTFLSMTKEQLALAWWNELSLMASVNEPLHGEQLLIGFADRIVKELQLDKTDKAHLPINEWLQDRRILLAKYPNNEFGGSMPDFTDGIRYKQNHHETMPEYILIENAGLVLLTPWFPRLFAMLGLLNEDKKDFRDMESRVKAVFTIQRLVTSEDREYREQELAFNRILVNCPFSIPLPKCLELDKETIEIVDSMLAGVKENWSQMKNTSIGGFQRSFIQRSGNIERREDKLVLIVEAKPFDTLLDLLPWSYKLVRFPWLEKRIHVSWRDKE